MTSDKTHNNMLPSSTVIHSIVIYDMAGLTTRGKKNIKNVLRYVKCVKKIFLKS